MESWRTYRMEEEEEGGREAGPHDHVLALMDGATASLRSVDPDAVQSGESPAAQGMSQDVGIYLSTLTLWHASTHLQRVLVMFRIIRDELYSISTLNSALSGSSSSDADNLHLQMPTRVLRQAESD